MINKIKITELKENPNNPRTISKDKFNKLKQSIKNFPKMLKLRPIVVDENNIVLGGNMRLKALQALGIKETWYIKETDLKDNEKQQFIIKDNVSFGDWDWDILANEWDDKGLIDWGVNVPTIKNTELLSGLKYEPIYYEPKNKPEIKLNNCVDLNKYNEKIKALDEYKLSNKQKDILKLFAYRFIKIDFESD